jgi:hypothetical protein
VIGEDTFGRIETKDQVEKVLAQYK